MKYFDSEKRKWDFWHTLSALLAVVGCVLIFLGFYEDPAGEVHLSVVSIFGQILLFIASVHISEFYIYNKRSKEQCSSSNT
jgi:drug/metabolite transporter (DMT)-like permease